MSSSSRRSRRNRRLSNYFPPLIENAVNFVCEEVQSHQQMVETLALSAMATACQGVIDVRLPGGLRVPTNLFTVLIADSGDRKTSTERLFFEPFKKFEEESRKNVALKENEWNVENEFWKEEEQELKRKIKKAIKAANYDEIDNLKHKMNELLERKLPPLVEQKIIYADTTIEGLLLGLHEKGKDAVLLSSEVGLISDKLTPAYLGYLDQLWDGDDIEVIRKTAQSFRVSQARLSMVLMLQPAVLDKLQKKHHGLAREIGLFARTLVCAPPSLQGSREVSAYSSNRTDETDLLNFHHRIEEILKTRQALQEKIVLELDQKAIKRWEKYCRDVEEDINFSIFDDGLSEISDFASKAGNNVLRIAGIVHYFVEGNTLITKESLLIAIDIVEFYIKQFIELFAPNVRDIPDLAYELRAWFRSKLKQDPTNNLMTRNYILQYGPAKLRKIDILHPVLDYLDFEGSIWYNDNSTYGGPVLIDLTRVPYEKL